MSSNIIIVGAGAAGLMAAAKLAKESFQVTVLEARDRIGGRIHTLSNKFSIPFDEGAEFVHGNQPVTSSILKSANAKQRRLKGQVYQIHRGEIQHRDFLQNSDDKDWDKLIEALNELEEDISIADFLKRRFGESRYASLRENAIGFVEGFDAADPNRVSALALKEEWTQTDDEEQYHVEGGYGKLIEYLAAQASDGGVDLILNQVVKEIETSSSGIVVRTVERTFYADKVIVTVPLGVLQQRTIRLIPERPEYDQAIQKLGFGGVIKYAVEFNEPFWESLPSAMKKIAFIFSDAQVPTWWGQSPDETPLLTGWRGGPSTFQGDHSQDALYSGMLTSLSYIFKLSEREIEKQIRSYHIVDWTVDQFTFGAYAYPTTELKNLLRLLMQPIDDKIFFAGEAIYDGASVGTVEAALVSGKEVAKLIILKK